MRFEGVLGAEIDGAAEEVFEFIGGVEEFPAEVRVGLEFDQDIDVGAGVGIAAEVICSTLSPLSALRI